ncbi:MAG: succinate--CoA ligase subunit alpha [Candidatus Aminicenantes bacterium]|nr:succinate--CoA ligase subunit alpha [Candidatus Aminicenantes bacterium]
MSILVNEQSKVLIQGITGREGMVRTRLMKDYGTQVTAGVTPGKGGQDVYGVPVYDSVKQAVEECGELDISVVFVPAFLVKEAALEAIDAGVRLAVLIPDRVPIHDVLEISRFSKQEQARFVGPNTLGLVSPGKAVLGMIGGRAKSAREWFSPGSIGVSSRSGGMTSAISYYLTKAGLGQSTIIHVGGDAVVGLSHPEVLQLFEEDPQTQLMVIFGEIGTSQEERVADLVSEGRIQKPVVAYIGGKAAKSGTRFSHAGAIVEGSRGSHESKVRLLKQAGVHVVDAVADIPKKAGQLLKEKGNKQ